MAHFQRYALPMARQSTQLLPLKLKFWIALRRPAHIATIAGGQPWKLLDNVDMVAIAVDASTDSFYHRRSPEQVTCPGLRLAAGTWTHTQASAAATRGIGGNWAEQSRPRAASALGTASPASKRTCMTSVPATLQPVAGGDVKPARTTESLHRTSTGLQIRQLATSSARHLAPSSVAPGAQEPEAGSGAQGQAQPAPGISPGRPDLHVVSLGGMHAQPAPAISPSMLDLHVRSGHVVSLGGMPAQPAPVTRCSRPDLHMRSGHVVSLAGVPSQPAPPTSPGISTGISSGVSPGISSGISSVKPDLNVVSLGGMPILQQLLLEEALLRADPLRRNWCLLNHGIPQPAVVMGISGRPEELLFEDEVRSRQLQVIRRFSGGGTVVVDHRTIFVTLIVNGSALPDVPLYPRPIMKWTEELYRPMFPESVKFSLVETDYALGCLKFGGNAQAIVKDRWLHHTSFLWDYDAALMGAVLKTPTRAPEYRKMRRHEDFVCKLQPLYSQQEDFTQSFIRECIPVIFTPKETSCEEATATLHHKHLSSTQLVAL